MTNEPLSLTKQLIDCESTYAKDAGSIEILKNILEKYNFKCSEFALGKDKIKNLYAEWGKGEDLFCFAGHVDVVPAGNLEEWNYPPFSATVEGDLLYGRGASDMKSGVAALVSAATKVASKCDESKARIGIFITADEEGVAEFGTNALIEELLKKDPDFRFKACITAEPTSKNQLGDMIKIGRRGSIQGKLTVKGTKGHIAYPANKKNAAHRLAKAIHNLSCLAIDEGNRDFSPSSLQVYFMHCDSKASNVIPSQAYAKFNIRTSPVYSEAEIKKILEKNIEKSLGDNDWQLDLSTSAVSFFNRDGDELISSLKKAINAFCKIETATSTEGGTSDSRFLCRLGPVVDFGLVGKTMHANNEHISITELLTLTDIFTLWLETAIKDASSCR